LKKPATKAEKEYMSRVASIGCIVCLNNGFPDTPCCLHHIRTGYGRGQRASHYEVLPLCAIHHQYGGHGEVAYHQSPTEFEARYGTELELLEQVRNILGTK